MSILHPLTCGFAKIAIYNIFTDTYDFNRLKHKNDKSFKGIVYQQKFDRYNQYFENKQTFKTPYKTFVNKFSAIVDNMRDLSKFKCASKHELLDTFSQKQWEELGDRKYEHSLFDCNACLKTHKQGLSKFLVKSKKFKAQAEKAGLYKEAVLADVTNKLVNQLNNEYTKKFNTTFTTQVKKMFRTSNQKENISIKKQKQHLTIAKKLNENIVHQWKETSVQRYVAYRVPYRY